MKLKNKSDFYSIEELEAIYVQWRKDKNKIDVEMEGSYSRDIDREYEKRLASRFTTYFRS